MISLLILLVAIQLKLFDIIFKPEKDYFFYDHLQEEKLPLYIDAYKHDYNDLLLILTENNENIKILNDINNNNFFDIYLEKKGKYFFEFIDLKKEKIEQYFLLRSYSLNKMIEEIDLNKNTYYGYFFSWISNTQYKTEDLAYYKVTNLKEDKLIYFTYGGNLYHYYYRYISIMNSLIICKNKNDECKGGHNSFTFLKGNNYTIYIKPINHYFLTKYPYYLYSYSFFPMSQNIFQYISQAGYYNIDSPKIFIFDNKEDYYIETYNIMPDFFFREDEIFDNNNNLCRFIFNIYNGVKIFNFVLKKDLNYRNIIFIPENNNKLKQIFISNKIFNDEEQIEVKTGKNYLIKLEDNYLSYLKTLIQNFISFTSPKENIKFIKLGNKIGNNKKYILGIWEKYLYIDKSNTDIIIKTENYEPRFLFFSILNDETIENYLSFMESKKIYINKRLNTDQISINDLFNIYIDKFDIKYNLYIKKYYGEIQLYESEYVLNNIKDNITILSKPINNLKNKKSVFNRLIQLDKNKIITGYLSTNSFMDIYLEKDDNKDIYLSEFKNRKYFKKGIEYHFHFYLNHLIKLEPQFKSEIIIYNEDTKIILNNNNQTGIIIGNNYKLKVTKNAMVYFYPRFNKFQKRIDPEKDQIIEIKNRNIFVFSIDFGFEGFEPPNMTYYSQSILYMENIYNKLETELAKGEYLYIYYDSLKEDDIEINYINNAIINTAYKFNFISINKNMKEKKLFFSNKNLKEFKLQINQFNANPPYKLKINYGGNNIHEYFGEKLEMNYNSLTFQALFESDSDLLLSYYYNDIKDEYLYYGQGDKWEKEIKEINKLIINNISLINETKIKINFNANYLNSLAKYIIIVTPETKNNTFEYMKNFLKLTDLINQKEGNFITEEYYDIGENYFIDYIIDISQFINDYNNIIINIISQELRYKKNINFYEPKYYILKTNIFTIITNILILILIVAVALFFIYVWIYLRKPYKKRNSKKLKLERFNEDFGVELNDDKEFVINENL